MSNDWAIFEEVYKNTEVKNSDFKPLPTGTYQAKVLMNAFDAGKMLFERQFEVISGEFTGKKQKDWLRLLKKDGTFSDNAISRLKKEIAALDSDLSNLPAKESIRPYCEGSLDQFVEIYVKTEPSTHSDGSPYFNKDGIQPTTSTIYINEFISFDPAAPF